MIVNYVCPLGISCHAANFLKDNKLKLTSYPFDWIFSSIDIVISCINDKFKIFLDKSYYKRISSKQCGHTLYHDKMFFHRSPLNKIDYNYYVRCVERFNVLLSYTEHKLFFIACVNNNMPMDEQNKNKFIELNNVLKNHTNNFSLLVLYHLFGAQITKHSVSIIDNITILELHTKNKSTGKLFIDNEDNIYLENIIKDMYLFDLKI